mgnify:CR=1 FL=1
MKYKLFISGMRVLFAGLLFFSLATGVAFSQEKTIQIVSEKSSIPVGDVFYKYGNKTGFSNDSGEISIEFSEQESLWLSHLLYKRISLSPMDVQSAFATGVIKLQLQEHSILPVTVISVHPSVGEISSHTVGVQDKLEHDAGQLLDRFSGISTIRKSAAYGFDPVLRGFKYDQLNLVIDGVHTASAACPNRMDPASSQIPVNMVAEVEVLKGPFSLRYGNVFGGTINFKTNLPQFSEKLKPVGRLGTSYESNGGVFRTEGIGGFTSQSADVKVFASYSKGSDYKDGDGNTVPANFNRLNWGGKLGFRLGEKQTIGFLVSNNRAHDVDFPTLPMDLREDNTWLLNANHALFFNRKNLSSLQTALYTTKVDHLMDNLDKVINPRTVDAVSDASTINYGGRSELRFDFAENKLFTGIDYRFEGADGFRTRAMLMGPMAGKSLTDNIWQDAQIQRGGVFGEFHLDRRSFQAVFSARLDYNSAVANNADPAFAALFESVESEWLNPSVSLGGTKMLGQKMSVGLWLGSAQRSPGIAERYINFFPIGIDPYEMVGNPQLKPETNNQADLIFQFETIATDFSINLFSSFLHNYISSEIDPALKPRLVTSPGVRRFVNIEKARMSGFEMSWKQQIFSFLKHDFNLVYTYALNPELDEPLPEIPPMEITYRLTCSFLRNKIQPEVFFRHAFKQDRIAVSYGETESPAFDVVDLKCLWLPVKAITVSAGIQNLFDVAYYEHLSRKAPDKKPIYSPGRSFYATVTFNFL